jgi:DNA polymerase III epsilon subunit-like protein
MAITYDHVYVDVETTGLDPRVDEVIEVTAIEYNLSGEVGKLITYMCRPMSGHVPKKVTDINGITYDMVKEKPYYLKDSIRDEVAKFIARRTLVGHNINSFDIKFLKIKPLKTIDTLTISKELFPRSRHSLGLMCEKLNIKFDKKEAHRAEYDVRKGVELHLKLNKILIDKSKKEENLPIFSTEKEQIEESIKIKKIGVIPTEEDKQFFYTQSYSYSRIKTFHECPFKWYMLYIKKVKEPERDYLVVGNACHKIAEEAGRWCYKETIVNKIISYKGRDLTFDPHIIFDDPSKISEYFPGCNGLYDLVHKLDSSITDYEKVSMPDRETYDKITNSIIARLSITDINIIGEIKYIMNWFYIKRNFSISMNGVLIMEKKLAFDKDWNIINDFFANNVFFRGIIDVIKYDHKVVVIIDYKTSRTMIKEEELENDMQLKMYVMMVYHFLPRNSYTKIIIKIDYIRFCKEIVYEIGDVEKYVNEAKQWVKDSIKLIETHIINKDGTAFQPKRNEHCGTCFLGEDGICPLFNKKFINDISDPFNFMIRSAEDCVAAYKKAEVLGAEYANLMKKCKEFVKTSDLSIIIDENARLGFYTKSGIDISAEKFALLMLGKNFKLSDFIKAFGVTKTSLEKIQKILKITLSDAEIESIGEKTNRIEFKALTQEEINKYINI